MGWIQLGCCCDAEDLVLHRSLSASVHWNQQGWAGLQLPEDQALSLHVVVLTNEGYKIIVKDTFFTTTVHFLAYLGMAGSGLASSGMALEKQCSTEGVKYCLLAGFPMALPCAVRTTGHAWMHLCAHGSCLALCSLFSSISTLLQVVNYRLLLCGCAKENCRLPLAKSCSLKPDIVLLGVQLLFCCFCFLFFFFGSGLFRVWMCYCQSFKAGRQKKRWSSSWLSLKRLL